jgi:hypothetical protein
MAEGSSRNSAPGGITHLERNLNVNNGALRNAINNLPGRPAGSPITAPFLHELLHEVVFTDRNLAIRFCNMHSSEATCLFAAYLVTAISRYLRSSQLPPCAHILLPHPFLFTHPPLSLRRYAASGQVSLFDRLITVRLAQVQLAMQIFDGSMLEYNLLMLLKNVAPAVQAQYNVEQVISDANAALPAPTTLTVPLTSLNSAGEGHGLESLPTNLLATAVRDGDFFLPGGEWAAPGPVRINRLSARDDGSAIVCACALSHRRRAAKCVCGCHFLLRRCSSQRGQRRQRQQRFGRSQHRHRYWGNHRRAPHSDRRGRGLLLLDTQEERGRHRCGSKRFI